MACLWPVPVMDLYINQGQVYCYMDFFGASLVRTFLSMVAQTQCSNNIRFAEVTTELVPEDVEVEEAQR
jgi:hypothetical protein